MVKIDIEPTWVELLRGVESGALKPSVLLKACETADLIRGAHKQGVKKLVITFNSDGSATMDKVK